MPQFEGIVQLYTGDGKGKTSAALGLALRALGQGLRVCVVQFAKATGVQSGEINALTGASADFEIVRFGDSSVWGGLMPERELGEEAAGAATEAFDYASAVVAGGRWDVVVLDEIAVVVKLGLVAEDDVLRLARDRPAGVELVLTGRGATPALIDACDLVTEMVEVRHPAQGGARARRGIEY